MDTIFGLIIISAILTPIFILSTLAIIDILKKLGFLKKKEESEEKEIKQDDYIKRIIFISIFVFFVTTGGLYYYFVRLPEVKECKKDCTYVGSERGSLTSEEITKVDYWVFRGNEFFGKKFKTQKQCIGYCLSEE